MIGTRRVPRRRTRHVLDALLVAWVAAWIALGVVVGREVQGLETLSETTVTAGRALETAGQALGGIADVPIVGENVRELADRTEEAGRSAVVSGRESRDSIHDLSILLAVAIGLVPSVPYVLLYLPLRLSWRRQAAAGTVAR
jgi:hypothetical protein